MLNIRALARARTTRGVVAVSATGALVVAGLSLGGASAFANSSAVLHTPTIGIESSAGYPSNPWFFGQNAQTDPQATVSDGDMALTGGTQLLHQFAGSTSETGGALQNFITGGGSETVTDGSASLQIPLFYGTNSSTGNPYFTTLRTATDPGEGVADIDSNDMWESSQNIGTDPSNLILAKNTPAKLSDIVADIEQVGPQQLLAFGVQATTATGVTLSGLSIGDVDYTFDDSVPTATATDTVLAGDLGRETTSYPANPWFYGDKGSSNDPTTSAVDSNGNFTLSSGTQLLHQFPGLSTATAKDGALDAFFAAGVSYKTSGDGTMSFQLPIYFGPSGTAFTTLYTGDDLPAGTHNILLSDQWRTTHTIGDVAAHVQTAPLSHLLSLIDAQGPQLLLASGVEGTVGSTPQLDWIQTGGTKYEFAQDVSVPTATTNTVVQSGAIGLETSDGYPSNSWFFGQNAIANPTASVVGTDLVVPAGEQVLHQFTGTAPTLRDFINSGANYTLAGDGTASFQIPLYYGSSQQFTTLRTATDLGAGSHDVLYGDDWTSSHDIGSTIAKNQTYTLSQLVTAIESAGGTSSLLGFGIQVTAGSQAVSLSSIQGEGTKYTFADTKALSFNSFTIAGTARVGETLTATSDLNSPVGTNFTYQWYENGTHAISGAKSKTHTVGYGSIGKTITVKVTAKKTGYTTASATAVSTAKVVSGVFAAGAKVTVSGSEFVGDKQTAEVATSPVASYTYQWRRNGTKISGATKSTYTLTSSDLNNAVTVSVKATKTGYSASALASPVGEAVGLGTFTLGATKVAGTVKAGVTIKASATASITGVTKVYEIFIGSGPSATLVGVSTSGSYKIPSYLKGVALSVTTLAFKAGYNSETSSSALTASVR